MASKNFLDQFSTNNKPDSFKEEVLVPASKPKKPLNKIVLIILTVVAVLGVFLLWFLFLRPTIKVPSFIGLEIRDVNSWVKQQGIEPSGIVIKDEYNDEYDADQIMYQSIEEGKKVRKNAKIDFIVSKGADPDVLIPFPDIMSMTKEEIQTWIKENKLQKTKISTAFNSEKEEGAVIEYKLTGVDEEDFTRGSTLKITVSKGPQPVEDVKMLNFVGKAYSEVATWASTNKIQLTKKEEYSNTVELDKVISQSVPTDVVIKQGDLVTIVVSKGKGLIMPDLKTMTRDEVNDFLTKNAGIVTKKELHVDTTDYVISQSVKPGVSVGSGDEAIVTVNLGSTFYLSEIYSGNVIGSRVQAIEDAFNKVRSIGIDGFVGSWGNPEGVYSYEYEKGLIVSATIADADGKPYDMNGRLPLNPRMDVVVSKGKIYVLENVSEMVESNKFIKAKLVDALAALNIPFDVSVNDDKCDLYINGEKKDTSLATIEIIQGQKVVLG